MSLYNLDLSFFISIRYVYRFVCDLEHILQLFPAQTHSMVEKQEDKGASMPAKSLGGVTKVEPE